MITDKRLKELDAKFEQVIQNAQMEVSDTEFTPDKAAARREKANASDLAFCKIYFSKVFDSEWNDLHREVATWERGNYTLEASRWFGKSAFTYIGKGVKHIAMGKGGIVNISSEKEDTAKNKTDMLSRVIQKNKLLCYDYGIEVIQDEKGNHIFKSDGGQTNLVATSVRMGLRSLSDDDFNRFRLSLMDDLYSRQSVKSDTHCEKVYDFITSEVWGMMEDDGLSIFLGNTITEDAPIAQIREEFTEKTGNYFVLPATNEDETESNWPERYPIEYIKANWMPPHKPYDVWMGDYKCQPVEVGDVMDPDWLKFININLINILAAISVADPAYGESPTACKKSLATVGIDDKHKFYVLDIYLRNEGYLLFFDYALEILKEYQSKVLLFENDFSQWTIASPFYQTWREQKKTVLPIIPFLSKELETEYRGADKESRIMNLVHPHQTGQLLYNEELKGDHDYNMYKTSNYLRFGAAKGTKLDGLDALASAYIQIWSYIETGAFKPLKRRKYTPTQMKNWFR